MGSAGEPSARARDALSCDKTGVLMRGDQLSLFRAGILARIPAPVPPSE
jgi:hypothetical protein